MIYSSEIVINIASVAKFHSYNWHNFIQLLLCSTFDQIFRWKNDHLLYWFFPEYFPKLFSTS